MTGAAPVPVADVRQLLPDGTALGTDVAVALEGLQRPALLVRTPYPRAVARALRRYRCRVRRTAPRPVLAIGLDYRDRAAEPGMVVPVAPMGFTTFASSSRSLLPGWTEMSTSSHVRAGTCRSSTASQVYPARDVQPLSMPQPSLGRSFEGFLPVGPVPVAPDEPPDRAVNGECRPFPVG